MDKNQIGTNAGIIWHMLSAKNKMTIKELLFETDLTLVDLATAIGWLARENKINFTEENGKEYCSVFQEFYY